MDEENITFVVLKMTPSIICWLETLCEQCDEDRDPILTWSKFVEIVREFYPSRTMMINISNGNSCTSKKTKLFKTTL